MARYRGEGETGQYMPWLVRLQKHPGIYGGGGWMDVLAAPKLLLLDAVNSKTKSP
jgi:hypothetical protein